MRYQTLDALFYDFSYSSFGWRLVVESTDEVEFIRKNSQYFDLACNVQSTPTATSSFVAIDYLAKAAVLTD